MARLLDAVRTGARLVLVGDPYQLASIEAGTVLADVVGPVGDEEMVAPPLPWRLCPEPSCPVRPGHRAPSHAPFRSRLVDRPPGRGRAGRRRRCRYRPSPVRAVRPHLGRPGRRRRSPPSSPTDRHGGVEVVRSALRGDAGAALTAANEVKVLAATRRGPLGSTTGRPASRPMWPPGYVSSTGTAAGTWDGRSSSTGNDRINQVANGDVGVVVRHQGEMVAALAGPGDLRYLSPSRLDRVETWWAMTIHRSQGSEYPHAVVSLPAATSPILTETSVYGRDPGQTATDHRGIRGRTEGGDRPAGGTGLGLARQAVAAVNPVPRRVQVYPGLTKGRPRRRSRIVFAERSDHAGMDEREGAVVDNIPAPVRSSSPGSDAG